MYLMSQEARDGVSKPEIRQPINKYTNGTGYESRLDGYKIVRVPVAIFEASGLEAECGTIFRGR
jgi:hypothetical protein